MSTVRAYDLTKHQRLIGVDGGRVTGKFAVLRGTSGSTDLWISTVDVTVWDEGKHGGRGFYSGDCTVLVNGDTVDRPRIHDVGKRADLIDAWDDFVAAVLAVAAVFNETQEATR